MEQYRDKRNFIECAFDVVFLARSLAQQYSILSTNEYFLTELRGLVSRYGGELLIEKHRIEVLFGDIYRLQFEIGAPDDIIDDEQITDEIVNTLQYLTI